MDPRDVNRINYNNYYVGQNLDFLIRSKMRSESLSTPLTNTPVFYDDQVSSKMALLGKRGFYDPGYIYGFDNQKVEKRENINSQNKSPPKYIHEREMYLNNPKNNYSQEQYELEMRRRQELERNKRERDEINREQYNNMREKEYNMRNELNQYSKNNNINEMIPQKYNEQNPNNNFDYRNNPEFQKEYNDYLKGENMLEQKGKNEGYNDQLNLPKTREQIQHDVYIENFKRQQLAKQMMMEDEMKYRQQYYK
jgi:hypothetical protein